MAHAPGITETIRPIITANTTQPASSLVSGIGESAAVSLGSIGETQAKAAELANIDKEPARATHKPPIFL